MKSFQQQFSFYCIFWGQDLIDLFIIDHFAWVNTPDFPAIRSMFVL